MNILITGGCGFIGSNIAEYFLENKLFDSITIVDNLSTGFMENIQNLLEKYKNIKFIEGDIKDIDVCRNITKNIDVKKVEKNVINTPNEFIKLYNDRIS